MIIHNVFGRLDQLGLFSFISRLFEELNPFVLSSSGVPAGLPLNPVEKLRAVLCLEIPLQLNWSYLGQSELNSIIAIVKINIPILGT